MKQLKLYILLGGLLQIIKTTINWREQKVITSIK